MQKYIYQAINESGSAISGVVDAESVETANSILAARGYIPTRIAKKGSVSSRLSWINIREKFARVKTPELILFTKQFRTSLSLLRSSSISGLTYFNY